MTPSDRRAYLRRMAEAGKRHNERDMDLRWRFGAALSHPKVDRSRAVQSLIDHDEWSAARYARAIELERVGEFQK